MKPGEPIPEKWIRWARVSPTSKAPFHLRNFLYVNEPVIDSYVEQMGGMPAKKRQKRAIGGSLAGPKADWSIEETGDEHSVEAKIRHLYTRLCELNLLTAKRPASTPKVPVQPPPIVYEKCHARLFLLPIAGVLAEIGVKALRLWVSQPHPKDFNDDPFEWRGSYLILTELHLDNQGFMSTISGCSALRFVANAAADELLFKRDGEEILGRWDQRHLTDKLIGLGAHPMELRQIEVMYRIRYMTNEQWYHDDRRRVHDILGYPLFISE